MGITEEFMAGFDEGYEKALPEEFLEKYYIIEYLGAAENCDTLLVKDKISGKKLVAKCYFGDATNFEYSGAKLLSKIDNDAVPHYEKECRNETCRCILREYIEGMTLAEYAGTNYLTEESITEIATKLVNIMKLLHEAEPVIIHRDIKPENIIIREDKSLALIDFGISRVYKKEKTSDTIWGGTRNFAPPEQYGFMQTDVRSDIYSFGVVLSWMLTGKEAPVEKPKTKLERIAAKCCAYMPERRYKNDALLLKDIYKTTEKYNSHIRNLRKKCAAAALVCTVLLVFAGVYGHTHSGEDAYTFHEPVIENAVRLSLNKPKGLITKEELSDVEEIYIFADNIYSDEEEYFEGQSKWYASEDRILGKTKSLIDIKYMKNLRKLFVCGNKVEDISPLRTLDKLEKVYLQENAVTDISALSDKPTLLEVSLGGNTLNDIEPVRTWPAIRELSLSGIGDCDGSPLETIKGITELDVFRGPDAGEYLDGLYVKSLTVGWRGQTDLEFIRTVSHVEELCIDWSTIRDISALDGREDIVYLSMKSCAIEDLSPLFTMPNLMTVVMSTKGKAQMEELAKEYDEPSFEIIYTE